MKCSGLSFFTLSFLSTLLWAECQTTPAPAPSIASTRCQKCPTVDSSSPLKLSLTVLVETDVAQFYSYNSEGAILVYFVARATFSEAPSQLQLSDFDVEEGSILEIVAENGCTDFLLKGTVKQNTGWLTNVTDIKVSVRSGATTTCSGKSFPSAAGTTVSRNGPIGSMYVPNMAYTAAGPITSAATNFVRIAFSEPIIGLDITQFNVTLKASPDTTPASARSNSRKLMQADGPAAAVCLPAYKSQAVPAVKNSTQFYNVFITLPDCFYGLVNVNFIGQVTNVAGIKSLPIKPVGYNRVATRIPIVTYSAFETLPAVSPESVAACI